MNEGGEPGRHDPELVALVEAYCNGTIETGHSGLCGHIIDSGEKHPWSSVLSWKNDMSNSSAISAAPM